MNNSVITPEIRKALKRKLEMLKKKSKVQKVDAELVVDNNNLPAIKKPKFMDLATSQHYIEQFIDKTPKEINDFIDKQSDLLMMYSKNAALELLAKAVETGDEGALEMYLKVIQASAVVAQEKVAVKKILGVSQDETAPKQYKADEMSPEEWEKAYKPGQPVVQPEQAKEPIWVGPSNKSVN